jgi:hypothetical protein
MKVILSLASLTFEHRAPRRRVPLGIRCDLDLIIDWHCSAMLRIVIRTSSFIGVPYNTTFDGERQEKMSLNYPHMIEPFFHGIISALRPAGGVVPCWMHIMLHPTSC